MIFLRILGIILMAFGLFLSFVIPVAGIIGLILGLLCVIRSSPKLADRINLSLSKKAAKSRQQAETLKMELEDKLKKHEEFERQVSAIKSEAVVTRTEGNRQRMEAAGLSMYIWSTCGDERVCEACKIMDDKLCLWADPTVYSRNKGKEWIPRPTGASLEHPGEKDGCRCTSLAYEPELLGEL